MDAGDKTTWDAVMRRNSNAPAQVVRKVISSPENVSQNVDDPAQCVEYRQQPYRNPVRNHRLLPDPSNESSWMDFMHILVHQHAKTIVHLQELTAEVEKLKDFRSSFISSITADLGKSSSAGPSDLHHLPQPKDVWTSSPNKLIDSGFSTETKESANQKEDEDPLYSLLDIIQTKVSSSISTTSNHNPTASPACNCSRVNNGTRQSASKLGKLDLVLGFKNGIGENVHIPREVIRAILREIDPLELQRQLLFAVANIKTLDSQLSTFEIEENNSRLASKYLALSHENEQLRFKLKEQEIQLEGTKAKLRILEKNGHPEAASLKLSLIPLDSLPRALYPASNGIPSQGTSHSATKDRSKNHLENISSCISPISSDPSSPDKNSTEQRGCDSSHCHMPATPHSSSALVTNKTMDCNFLPQEHQATLISSNENVKPCSDKNAIHDRTTHLNMSEKLEKCHRGEVNEKELGGQRLRPSSAVSRIPTRIVSSPCLSHPTHQSISSKSPGSSISSKSSIPVAITRLKRNGSVRNVMSAGTTPPAGKKSTSNFWAAWFAT